MSGDTASGALDGLHFVGIAQDIEPQRIATVEALERRGYRILAVIPYRTAAGRDAYVVVAQDGARA